jgi:ATP/maltotriose-dependent transcriptional regulator MalT
MVGTGRKGAMEEYIAVLGRAVPHMAKVMNGCMAGLDILTAGELYYSKGDMKNAEITFVRGLAVARANKQYDFQCRVLFYLMRIGFFLGDYERVQEALSSLESLLDETGYLISETAYDITMGWYHIFIGEPEQMADWLKGDFDYDAAGFFLENLENIIKTRYYVLKGRWRELLEYLKYRRGKEAIFYGKLGIKILESLCYYNLKDKEAAFGAFTEAYELSESNQLITAFIEYGRYMRTLTIAAMKDRSCKISQEWLKMIKSKSETFSKYRLQVVAEYKAKNGITDEVNLSIREREVLVELYKGLSNQDIAIRQDLSITWVKQIINNIRVKLGAETAVDIVRIATERKMV